MSAKTDAFADLVVMTVKSALTPVLERLAAAEARIAMLPSVEQTVGDVRDRVLAVETKSVPVGPSAAELELSIRNRVDPVQSEISALNARVAVLEVRAAVPGPAGRDGLDGKDGSDGLNGSDGMGWDDLVVTHDGERSFSVQLVKGDRVKDTGTFTVPVEIYRGVYTEGKTYERGDGVTWGGSEWHCNDTTSAKPGDGANAWTLKVKRGRDGKDGRDAEGALPVVAVGGRA